MAGNIDIVASSCNKIHYLPTPNVAGININYFESVPIGMVISEAYLLIRVQLLLADYLS
jgi:hypothetical protein